jgi:hypothetical protein
MGRHAYMRLGVCKAATFPHLRAPFMPELEKTYTPADVEARWYQRWLDDKCFEA